MIHRRTEKPFFARVYDLVATIPQGKVMTYGQIAACLGGVCSPKIVGFAMSCAPASRNLPCHRVIAKAGTMAKGDTFGGEEAQRQRLMDEGVVFLPNGRVDMDESLYIPMDI